MTDGQTNPQETATAAPAMLTQSTAGLQQVLYLLEQAFEGDTWHGLLTNLTSITPEEWRWQPQNGERAIRDIVAHVGTCKLMYENHAFGDATLRWDQFTLEEVETPDAAMQWLRTTHERLHASVAALADDAELLQLRPANWGGLKETRWLITVLIGHDLYHAGEINHLRSLYKADDRWAYQKE